MRVTAHFCLQKYSVFPILQSSREQQGSIGNLKEKATHFIGRHLHLFALFSSFTVRWVQRYVMPIQNSIGVIQVAACGTFNVAKRYHIYAQILSFAISVQYTANVGNTHIHVFVSSYHSRLCFLQKSHFLALPRHNIRVNFIADRRNIMQALSECLELPRSLNNFVLGNKTKHIMKKNADKGNSVSENNTPKQKKTSSKNGKIETYLSSRYEFRYNTVLGRTEYRRMNSNDFTKVGRYEINTLRRELDNDVGIITSSDNLYSIIESSFSPRINPIQEYFKALPLVDIGCDESK